MLAPSVREAHTGAHQRAEDEGDPPHDFRTRPPRNRGDPGGSGRPAPPAAEGEGSAFSLLMERGPRPIEQMCVALQERGVRDWLGREDSNLENPPERCGMEFPDPERPGITYLLLANCATGTP